MFDLALLEEPLNAALRERYASFLLRTLNRPEEAIGLAREATKLDPQSGEAWLTLGLIEYKLNNLPAGDQAIEKALENGKPKSLCYLRQGMARYHVAKREPYSRSAMKLLREAEMLIEKSTKLADTKDFYYKKNAQNTTKYLMLTQALISQINRREVKAENAPS